MLADELKEIVAADKSFSGQIALLSMQRDVRLAASQSDWQRSVIHAWAAVQYIKLLAMSADTDSRYQSLLEQLQRQYDQTQSASQNVLEELRNECLYIVKYMDLLLQIKREQ